jgi:hypothetical protein
VNGPRGFTERCGWIGGQPAAGQFFPWALCALVALASCNSADSADVSAPESAAGHGGRALAGDGGTGSDAPHDVAGQGGSAGKGGDTTLEASGTGGSDDGALAGAPSAGNGGEGGVTSGGGTSGGARSTQSYPPGPPGCGLDAAAFCATFDAPAGKDGREGELDPTLFSAARMCNIGGPTGDGEAIGIAPGTVPTCRSGLPAQVSPDSDALVCDGNDAIQSNHLLVVVAAQNYGQNSYRIRQPFDFAGRSGKIVFDAQGYNVGLLGWISLEITEDPAPAPSFTLQQNYENGAIPRNGIEIQFSNNCAGDHVGVGELLTYDDYVQTEVFTSNGAAEACATAAEDRLNRFSVELSQDHVEVFATDASDDGKSFGAPISLLSRAIQLPFSRGYVHLTTHNHATVKYSNDTVDAWTARWDNVGFDGPVLKDLFREYEAPDSLFATPGKVNIGYRLADAASGPAQQIQIENVKLAQVTSARVALGNWSLKPAGAAYADDFALNYRLNGHAWKANQPDAAEVAMITALPNAGTRATLLDVDVADLVEGTNVLELTTTGAPMSYPPVAFNIDLILSLQ